VNIGVQYSEHGGSIFRTRAFCTRIRTRITCSGAVTFMCSACVQNRTPLLGVQLGLWSASAGTFEFNGRLLDEVTAGLSCKSDCGVQFTEPVRAAV
jgi:hypothetical protein